jgi:hypothetical protein
VRGAQRAEEKWMGEYTDGQGQEIYCVPMSPNFIGKLFPVAVNVCFHQFSVCVIGVQTLKVSKRRSSTVGGAEDVGSVVDGAMERAEIEDLERERMQLLVNPKDYQVSHCRVS